MIGQLNSLPRHIHSVSRLPERQSTHDSVGYHLMPNFINIFNYLRLLKSMLDKGISLLRSFAGINAKDNVMAQYFHNKINNITVLLMYH